MLYPQLQDSCTILGKPGSTHILHAVGCMGGEGPARTAAQQPWEGRAGGSQARALGQTMSPLSETEIQKKRGEDELG